MRVLDRKIIVSVLLSIFAFYLIFLFVNNNQGQINSNNLVCTESLQRENFNYENENLVYKNSEISIFPDISNIFCFNKIKSINTESNQTIAEYYFSTRFNDIIFSTAQFLLIVSFFSLRKKMLYHLSSVGLLIVHIIAFNPYFYNLQSAYKLVFLTIANNILFYFFTKENKENNYFDYVSLFLLFLLFNSYHIFSNLLVFYFFLFYKKGLFEDKNTIENYKSVIFNLPIYFYLIKLTSGLSSNFSTIWKSISNSIYETFKIFGDLQIIFRTIHCNSSSFVQDFKFASGLFHTCPFETGYPIVDYFIAFDVNNIWLASISMGLITLIIFSIFYKNIIRLNSEYSFIIFILVLSSPANFLFDRLNLDIFIIFLCYFAVKFLNKYPIISILGIVFLFTIKIYPIFLLISSAIIHLKNKKDLKIFYIHIIGLLFSIYYFYDLVFIKKSRLTATNNPNELFQGFSHFTNDTLTFGYLTHLRFFERIFSFTPALIILLLLILIIFIFIHKTQNKFVSRSNSQDLEYLIIAGAFILISLFENYDYRICFLFLIFKYIFDNKNQTIQILYMTIFLTSATFYSLFNTVFVVLNIISFTILIQFFIVDYLQFIKNANYENIK